MAGQAPQPPGLRDVERKGGDPVRNARLRSSSSSRPASCNSDHSPRSNHEEEKCSMTASQLAHGDSMQVAGPADRGFRRGSRDNNDVQDEEFQALDPCSSEKGNMLGRSMLMEELVRAYDKLEQETARRKLSENQARAMTAWMRRNNIDFTGSDDATDDRINECRSACRGSNLACCVDRMRETPRGSGIAAAQYLGVCCFCNRVRTAPMATRGTLTDDQLDTTFLLEDGDDFEIEPELGPIRSGADAFAAEGSPNERISPNSRPRTAHVFRAEENRIPEFDISTDSTIKDRENRPMTRSFKLRPYLPLLTPLCFLQSSTAYRQTSSKQTTDFSFGSVSLATIAEGLKSCRESLGSLRRGTFLKQGFDPTSRSSIFFLLLSLLFLISLPFLSSLLPDFTQPSTAAMYLLAIASPGIHPLITDHPSLVPTILTSFECYIIWRSLPNFLWTPPSLHRPASPWSSRHHAGRRRSAEAYVHLAVQTLGVLVLVLVLSFPFIVLLVLRVLLLVINLILILVLLHAFVCNRRPENDVKVSKIKNKMHLGVSSFRIAQAFGHLRPQQLVPAVSRSLHALEAVGLVYRTFDDSHYLVTNEGAEIGDEGWQKVLRIVRGGEKENKQEEEDGLEQGLGKRRDVRMSKNFLGGDEMVCRYSRKVLKRECTGYADLTFRERAWVRSLQSCRKALICSYSPANASSSSVSASSSSSSRFSSLEFNPSSEYLLCGRGSGQLLIFKTNAASARYVEEWEQAGRFSSLNAVRDVDGRRTIDAAHWNPLNRNEVGVSSRSSDEVHTYDMKVCGNGNKRR
eukprot:766073-Hanusia_phi.AAC.7